MLLLPRGCGHSLQERQREARRWEGQGPLLAPADMRRWGRAGRTLLSLGASQHTALTDHRCKGFWRLAA